MSKRQVWVVEGRRKGRVRELWRPQTAPVERGPALDKLTLYSERNTRYEFRVTKYVPEAK